jgi:bifunctional N-acetylglucosamine-1-phosphate-uridyltransferase/glucosamine-1-phosphate-acetyltransferase GlmU-like protein
MMVVNGRPLISSAISEAYGIGSTRIIVVAAPENAAALSHYLPSEGSLRMVVQLRPTGPGDGLLLGLDLVRSSHVLVLMGDNVFGPSDVSSVAKGWHLAGSSNAEGADAVVGVRHLEDLTAFTRLRSNGRWVEKTEALPEDFPEGRSKCWVGPLAAKTEKLQDAIQRQSRNDAGERAIGPALNHLEKVATVRVETYDIGVPEAWTP